MANLDFSDTQTEADLDGYSPLKDGTYHLVVLECDDSFTKFHDSIMLECEVLTGTVAGQTGKKVKTFFNNPSPNHKDGGRFCRQRQGRLAMVLGLIDSSAFGKQVSVDFTKAAGRQLMATVKSEQKSDGGKSYPSIDGMAFGTLTDPAYAEIPKDVDALRMAGVSVAQPVAAAPAPQSAPMATSAPVSASAPTPAMAAAAPAADPFAGL